MSKPLEIGAVLELVMKEYPDIISYVIFTQVRKDKYKLIGVDGNRFSDDTFGEECTIDDIRRKYTQYSVYLLVIDLFKHCRRKAKYSISDIIAAQHSYTTTCD